MELRRVAPSTLDLMLGRLRQLPEAAVQEKLCSLRSKGQLSPLVAAEHEGRLVLVDGFARQLAATRLGLELVLVEVVRISPAQMKAQVYLRNRERGLLLLEECRLVRELRDADGLNQVEIGELLERHKSWVCRRLALQDAVSPHLLCDLSLGLLSAGSLRRLAQLPPRNQEELVAAARRDELKPCELARLVELWQRAPDAEARRYLLCNPQAALALARGEGERSAEPRLSDGGRQLVGWLERMSQLALRARRQLREGVGALPVEGLALITRAHGEADQLCRSALDEIAQWLLAESTGATHSQTRREVEA